MLFLFLILCIGNYLVKEKSIHFNDTEYYIHLVLNSNLDGDLINYEFNNIKVNSLILYENNPMYFREEKIWYGLLNVGDVLVLNINEKRVLKRIKQIVKGENGYLIKLDNDVSVLYEKPFILDTEGSNMIIGKVTGENLFFGKILAKFFVLEWFVGFVIMPLLMFVVSDILLYFKTRGKFEKG